jgi:hypothetical protein
MQNRPLLVGKPQKGCLDLLETYPGFLLGRRRCIGEGRSLLKAARLCHVAAAPVDEDVVQDREQPAAQVAARAERASPLIRADQGVLHQILSLALVPCQ